MIAFQAEVESSILSSRTNFTMEIGELGARSAVRTGLKFCVGQYPYIVDTKKPIKVLSEPV